MAIDEFKLDLFQAIEKSCEFKYKLFILKGTVNELEKIISEQRGKYKMAANLALSILKTKKVELLQGEGEVDDLLVTYSKKGYLVLTQDIELKKRLTKPYLTIRQRKKVIMITKS